MLETDEEKNKRLQTLRDRTLSFEQHAVLDAIASSYDQMSKDVDVDDFESIRRASDDSRSSKASPFPLGLSYINGLLHQLPSVYFPYSLDVIDVQENSEHGVRPSRFFRP